MPSPIGSSFSGTSAIGANFKVPRKRPVPNEFSIFINNRKAFHHLSPLV